MKKYQTCGFGLQKQNFWLSPTGQALQIVDWEELENHPGLCESQKRPLLSGINYAQGRGVRAVCSLSGLLCHLTLWDINPQDSLVIFNLHQCLFFFFSFVPLSLYLWGCLLFYRVMSQEGRAQLQISRLSLLRQWTGERAAVVWSADAARSPGQVGGLPEVPVLGIGARSLLSRCAQALEFRSKMDRGACSHGEDTWGGSGLTSNASSWVTLTKSYWMPLT